MYEINYDNFIFTIKNNELMPVLKNLLRDSFKIKKDEPKAIEVIEFLLEIADSTSNDLLDILFEKFEDEIKEQFSSEANEAIEIEKEDASLTPNNLYTARPTN